MDFTREPIIETIISPREGFKLVVRNSKSDSNEEYSVDAVEVVSFGNALFFRSQERPKSFLLPISDYEVVELRESRAVLKTPQVEKTIKIGGGKEASKAEEEAASSDTQGEKKRGRRQSRRKRSSEKKPATPKKEKTEEKGGDNNDETSKIVSSSTINRLLPPPPGLISESIGRQKETLGASGEPVLPSTVEEEVPLPQGNTPEESEPETEGPVPAALPSAPILKEEDVDSKNLLESELQHAKKDPKPALEEAQVPVESATPDQNPAKVEDDEPGGDSSTLSRNVTPSQLGDGNDPFLF